MASLFSEYPSPLTTADVLRQMYMFDLALRCLDGADSPSARSLRIRTLRGAGRNGDALQHLGGVSASDNDDVELRANRIAVLDRLRRYDDLAELIGRPRHAELLASQDTFAYRVRLAQARALASQGRVVDALAGFEAVARTVDSPTVHGWRLNALLRLGRRRDARELALELAMAEGESGPRRWIAAGRVLSRLGDSDQAARTLERATQEAPCDPHAWRYLAAALRTIGDFDATERALLAGAEVSVPVPDAGSQSGLPAVVPMAQHPLLLVERALLHLARFDGDNVEQLHAAREDAEAALVNSPYCAEAYWIKARVLRATGGPDALNELRRMVRERRRSGANVWVELGHAYADATRWSEAVAEYDAVLGHNPHNREALLGRLTVLASQTVPDPGAVAELVGGLADPSRRRLTEAVHAVRDELRQDVVILSIAGERLAQGGHYRLAGELFDTVLDGPANPRHDLSYAGAIRAWGWARDFEAAETAYHQAVAHCAGDGDPPADLPVVIGIARGLLLGDQGRFVEANQVFQNLYDGVVARPGDERGRDDQAAVAVWLSTSYRWLAEHERAREVVTDALRASPEHGERALFARAPDLYDELGWTCFEQQDWSAAQDSFRRALTIDPRHAGALRGLLQVHRATGDLPAAQDVARRARILHPADASLQCELAWLHGEAGEFRAAQRFLDHALTREVANTPALEWKIVYLIREGRLDDAERAAHRGRALRPESPGILEAACAVDLRRGNGREAMRTASDAFAARGTDHRFAMIVAAVCEQIGGADAGWRRWADQLDRFPTSLDAVRVQASLRRRHGELERARQLVEMRLPLRWPGRRGELAEILLDDDDPDGALEVLYDMHEQVPWSWSIARRIATVLATHDRVAEAVDFVANLVAQAPDMYDPVELLVLYGELLLRGNRFEEALAAAERAGRHPTRQVVEAEVLAIDALGAAGRTEEAIARAESLRRSRPGSRRVRLILARCLDETRRGREAADLLDGAELSLPHHPPAIATMSWISRGLGDPQRAEQLLNHALEHMPDEPALLAERGWIYLRHRHRLPAARDVFTDLVGRRLRHAQALGHTGLGWCHLQLSPPDPTAALREFAAATERDPQLPQARLGASEAERVLASEKKSGDERLDHLERSLRHARRLLDMEQTSVSHSAVGRSAYELKDIVTARIHLQASVRLHPHRGDRVGLGLLLLRQGAHDEALEVLLAGLAYDPDDPDLLAALGAVYLDQDLRVGNVGHNTHLAVRYLRDACARAPNHLFAKHNLATAYVRLGEPAAAEQQLESALHDLRKAQGVTGVDVDDIPMVQLRLAEILRQRPGVTAYAASWAKARWLLASVRRNARGWLRELAADDRTRPWSRADDVRPQRLQTAAGYLVAVLALAGLSTLWVTWLTGIRTEPPPLSGWVIVTLTCALLGAVFAGLTLPTIQRLRFGAVEINSFVELSRIVSRDLDLPEPTFRHGSFGSIDAIRAQWSTPWTAETRLPRLGPAVSPLINTYYAHRDAYLPWRRL